MLRKTLITTCALSTLSGLSLAPLSQAIGAELGKPNFVTIVIDDMGFSDLGAFGSEIDTPHLDELAENGLTLTNFYAAPTSTPARAMFFTGKNNHESGVGNMAGFVGTRPRTLGQPGYEGELVADVPIFPEFLQSSGYHTMMTGKWDLGEEPGKYPTDRGFNETLVLLPGGDVHYLSDDQGRLITSQPPSYYQRLGRTSPYNRNGQELTEFPPNAFSTEFYTDSAISMLDEWVQNGRQQPFYLNIAHIASHGPFQAPEALIQKYLPLYAQGWDVIRAERFDRLKAQGYIPADLPLPPLPPEVQPWNSLSADEQAVEARRMAIYAGLVEMLDRSVGELVQYLQNIGEYQNTAFFIFSDNGAAAIESGTQAKQQYVEENFTKDTFEDLDSMGGPDSFIPPSPGWGMTSNTPFNRYKNSTFDGGMHAAALVHYPNSQAQGVRYTGVTSVMDIAPTILDLADIPYTDPKPMDGVSMTSLLQGNLEVVEPLRTLVHEQDGIKMVRRGDWKLAQKWDYSRQRWDSNVYLFHLRSDPTEQYNLRWMYPEIYDALWQSYEEYAEANQVIEVGSRIFGTEVLGTLIYGEPSTEGFILGGTQVNYRSMFHPINATASAFDVVDIAAEISPPAAHVGKPGQVIAMMVEFRSSGDWQWFTFSGGDRPDSAFGIMPWDGTSQGIPTYRDFSSGLPERIDVPLYEGLLTGGLTSGLSGRLEFLVGYRLFDGTMVYNEKPFSLTVE